jgi:hypothetical protein
MSLWNRPLGNRPLGNSSWGLAALGAVLGGLGCSSSATATDSTDSGACQQTMCDFKYALCESNGQNSATGGTDDCGSLWEICQDTPTVAICVDDIGDPSPDGKPCNADMSAAACACGDDPTCGAALYAANPACQQCDQGWQPSCETGACATPLENASNCVSANQCCDESACAPCAMQFLAIEGCVNAAVANPSDPGGCYSGSHACWVSPVCPN